MTGRGIWPRASPSSSAASAPAPRWCGPGPDRRPCLRGCRPLLGSISHSPEWRNWQTRKIQVLVQVTGWRFKSSLGHFRGAVMAPHAVRARAARRLPGSRCRWHEPDLPDVAGGGLGDPPWRDVQVMPSSLEADAAHLARPERLESSRVLHGELERRSRRPPRIHVHHHLASSLPAAAALQHLHGELARLPHGE